MILGESPGTPCPAPSLALPRMPTPASNARLAVLAAHVVGAGSDVCRLAPCPADSAALPNHPPLSAVVGGSVADITATAPAGVSLLAGGSVPGGVRLTPGGVGRNVAAAAARLLTSTSPPGEPPGRRAAVSLISAVGDDALGAALLGSLCASGLDPAACAIAAVQGFDTPAVVTVLDGRGEGAASVADFEGGGGATSRPSAQTPPPSEGALGAALGTRAGAAAALAAARVAHATVVALDGNLPGAALAAVAACLPPRGPDLFEPVSVAKAGRAIAAGVRVGIATPNAAELRAMAAAARAVGGGGGSGGGGGWRRVATSHHPSLPPAIAPAIATLAHDAEAVLAARWARGLVVTLGGHGVAFLTGEADTHTLPFGPGAPPPPPSLGPLHVCYVPAVPDVAVVSAVGAGDALAGGLLVGGVEGKGLAEALGLGAAAAAQVVTVNEAAPSLDVGRARREGQALAGRAVWSVCLD